MGAGSGDGGAKDTQAVSLRKGEKKKGNNGGSGKKKQKKTEQEAENANEVKEPQK